jgi:hypothetical protein
LAPTTPSRRAATAAALLCPTCNGDSFAERSSFKTATERLLGASSVNVIIDLMSCDRCGENLPAVRGKRRFALLKEERLTALLADLDEAKRVNSEMQGVLDAMTRRSQSLSAEVERCRAEGETSVMETRAAALEMETDGLEGRRARLAKTLELMASRVPIVS